MAAPEEAPSQAAAAADPADADSSLLGTTGEAMSWALSGQPAVPPPEEEEADAANRPATVVAEEQQALSPTVLQQAEVVLEGQESSNSPVVLQEESLEDRLDCARFVLQHCYKSYADADGAAAEGQAEGQESSNSSAVLQEAALEEWISSLREPRPARSPPRHDRSPADRRRRGAVFSRLRKLLLRRFGTFSSAWRQALDTTSHGTVGFRSFVQSARELGLGASGDLREAWRHMDPTSSGNIHLVDLDWQTADLLGRFHFLLLGRYETVGAAVAAWGLVSGKRLSKDEFCKQARQAKLLDVDQAGATWDLLCYRHDVGIPGVGLRDFEWLEAVSWTLPKTCSPSRVLPGCSADATDEALAVQGTAAEAVLSNEDNVGGEASEFGMSGDDGGSSEDLIGPVWDRLYETALFDQARERAVAALQKQTRPALPEETPKRMARLYEHNAERDHRRLVRADKYYANILAAHPTSPRKAGESERIWERLLRTDKQERMLASAPKPSKTQGLLSRSALMAAEKGQVLSAEQAAIRLYEDSQRRTQRKLEQLRKAEEREAMAIEELKAEQNAGRPMNKQRRQYLYTDAKQREERRAARQALAQKNKRASMDEWEKARGPVPEPTPEAQQQTCMRLHLEGTTREARRAHALREQEEKDELLAESTRRRPVARCRELRVAWEQKHLGPTSGEALGDVSVPGVRAARLQTRTTSPHESEVHFSGQSSISSPVHRQVSTRASLKNQGFVAHLAVWVDNLDAVCLAHNEAACAALQKALARCFGQATNGKLRPRDVTASFGGGGFDSVACVDVELTCPKTMQYAPVVRSILASPSLPLDLALDLGGLDILRPLRLGPLTCEVTVAGCTRPSDIFASQRAATELEDLEEEPVGMRWRPQHDEPDHPVALTLSAQREARNRRRREEDEEELQRRRQEDELELRRRREELEEEKRRQGFAAKLGAQKAQLDARKTQDDLVRFLLNRPVEEIVQKVKVQRPILPPDLGSEHSETVRQYLLEHSWRADFKTRRATACTSRGALVQQCLAQTTAAQMGSLRAC